MGKKAGKNGDEWLEAKRRCRLTDEEVRMAKELGFKPHSLIKNIPAKSQPWKAPVGEWIRDLHAKRFGESSKPVKAKRPGQSPNPPARASSARIPGQISQPKNRVTVQTMAEVIRRIEGLDQAAEAKLYCELVETQPEALRWVAILRSVGVSAPVVDHVLHLLLVISESIKKTIRGPLRRITEDDFERANTKVQALSRLLKGESKNEVAWLTYLMAEAHPERNLYAYIVTHLSEKSGARERPGDERAIYATAVLLEAFLLAAGLAQTRE
jgi:hypothetical protein